MTKIIENASIGNVRRTKDGSGNLEIILCADGADDTTHIVRLNEEGSRILRQIIETEIKMRAFGLSSLTFDA